LGEDRRTGAPVKIGPSAIQEVNRRGDLAAELPRRKLRRMVSSEPEPQRYEMQDRIWRETRGLWHFRQGIPD
jgi:hypothetical protein